jgi:hypothetical protein
MPDRKNRSSEGNKQKVGNDDCDAVISQNLVDAGNERGEKADNDNTYTTYKCGN